MPTARDRKLAYVAWVVVCLVWGTTYLGIRVALETVPVALLAGLRWTAAGVLMTAALPLLGERLPPLRTWGAIALTGFLMAVLGNGGVVWAEQYVTSGLAAVIVAMVPFWQMLIEALLPGGERLTRRGAAGLALGFAGIVVLVWPELALGGAEGRWFVYGIVALQVACVGWALGTSYTKRNRMSVSPLSGSALQMLLSGVMLLGIATAAGEWPALTFTARTAGAMIYLVVFGSIVGYSAYLYALKHLPLSTVSLYAYVNPIIAVVLGALVLDEALSGRVIVASLLVFAGIAIVRSARPTVAATGTPRPGNAAAAVTARADAA